MTIAHQVHHTSGGVKVSLSGEIDMVVRDDLRRVLHAAVAVAVTELDLRQVTYLDCTSIGEIVRAHLEARRRGRRLIVTQPQGIVELVLTLTNVLPLLAADPRERSTRSRAGQAAVPG